MQKIDISNIVLNENAYFYYTKKRISKSDIVKLFKEARDDKKANRIYDSIVRHSLFEGSKQVAKYSLDIFDFVQKPSFLKAPQKLWETKTALFLVLEYKDLIVVMRKNISGISTLRKLSEPVDYTVLANFNINDTSKFEKIRSNSLNTAENAMQSKVSEARNLQGVLTRFGISKMTIDAMRIDNDGQKSAIALNTSRVNSLNVRSDFEVSLFWAIKVCNLLNAAKASGKVNKFIAGFATPIDFESEIDKLTPKFL